MKTGILRFIAALMIITSFIIIGCSDDKGADVKKTVTAKEKGAVEKLTHEAAQEAVKTMKTPIDKAQAVKDKQEGDYSSMERTLKE